MTRYWSTSDGRMGFSSMFGAWLGAPVPRGLPHRWDRRHWDDDFWRTGSGDRGERGAPRPRQSSLTLMAPSGHDSIARRAASSRPGGTSQSEPRSAQQPSSSEVNSLGLTT